MKAIELLQYLKDGMDTGYPPKHIINNAIKEIEDLEESNKEQNLEKWFEHIREKHERLNK